VVTGVDTSDAEAERVLNEASARRRARARAPLTLKRFDAPRWVMLRSAIVPGWGQLHNGSWLKALGIAAGEAGLGIQLIQDDRELNRLSRISDQALADSDFVTSDVAVNAYNDRLTASNARRWLLGALVAYAMADAYVDAHFRYFNVEFDTPPAAGGGGRTSKIRLGLRWSF
jgi:hypothetical protein